MSWPRAMRRGRGGATMSLVNVTFDDLVSDVRRILSGPDGPIALALALGLGAIVETFLYAADPGDRASCLIANLLATLPLVFWRTRLPWVAGVVTFASLVAVASNPTLLTLSGITAQLIVVYLVANRYRRRWSVLLAAPFLVAAVAWSGEDTLAGVMLLVLVVAAQVLGDSRRQRSQAIAERDATRHAMAETQRDQVIMEERARIARELHDVVAHHVSVIAVQAETARLTTPDMPEEGKERLAAIGQTARDSLTELRRLLGVLRADGGPEAARSPQPGLGRLAELDRQRPLGRNTCAADARRRRDAPAAGRRPDGVPDRAGGTHERAATRSGRVRRRHARLRGARASTAGERRRARTAGGRHERPRAARHAGARNHGRRQAEDRPRRRRRLRRRGRAPPLEARAMTVRVVVADDQEIVRAGFAALLETQDDFAVAGTAADGVEAVELCRAERPDVVLMDVRMPSLDGIEATRLLAADGGKRPRILMLTTFDLDEYVYDALSAGASGFLLKDVAAETLFDAVRVVAAGEALLAPAVTRRLIDEFARLRPRAPARPELLEELTPRETEVLCLVAEGLSNDEIAERLVVSKETVKTHVSRVLGKLSLRDRSQAVIVAYESGLVVPRS